ncbi:N-(5'-phosphoribosyl)anthranilate isomerase [Alphaproteobacteria bacterium]|nr:N-(5'-phosphoribosyl)anthranilate isomerase [Alphaproteobacteria bacterium]
MTARIKVKICGLTDGFSAEAAIRAGADYLGVVFFENSPRKASVEQAQDVFDGTPEDVKRVGLFVDADDSLLDRAIGSVRLDMLQFHGTETPERVERVRLEYGIPVIKAVQVACAADLDAALPYVGVADALLFDAKPPVGAERPGGHGVAYDWSLLAGRRWPIPWFLAGGLTAENVAGAIRASGAKIVDVSSGVEKTPGVKDAKKIIAFIRAVKGVRDPDQARR